jgi:hypothetical protein
MDSMHAIARNAIDQMPPDNRFRPTDAEAIARHRALLHSLGPDIVQRFYDTLFGHPRTAAVFHEGERPARENTLVHWWQRTVDGPLDDDYFAWMAMVGLVHVVRDVSNPMMLSMADQVARFVTGVVGDSDLDRQEINQLSDAFRRLTATVSAIITFGYDQAVVSALFDVAGMPEPLLRRLRNQEVASSLTKARADLGR